MGSKYAHFEFDGILYEKSFFLPERKTFTLSKDQGTSGLELLCLPWQTWRSDPL